MRVIAFPQLWKLLDVVRGMCRQPTHDGILRPVLVGPTQETPEGTLKMGNTVVEVQLENIAIFHCAACSRHLPVIYGCVNQDFPQITSLYKTIDRKAILSMDWLGLKDCTA